MIDAGKAVAAGAFVATGTTVTRVPLVATGLVVGGTVVVCCGALVGRCTAPPAIDCGVVGRYADGDTGRRSIMTATTAPASSTIRPMTSTSRRWKELPMDYSYSRYSLVTICDSLISEQDTTSISVPAHRAATRAGRSATAARCPAIFP